ncbi:MAG TPA: nucleotidyltransferase domain-containing protein [Thermoanaerobaculia bacterium]|nr:nucleotidyltransferase domain-containing protein [Thermoanaerobaculia bacterium]
MEEVIRPLLDDLDRRFGVDTLWVFGSEASGRARAESDLDVAALFSRPPSAVELADARAEGAVLLNRPLDLVDLDMASPILAYQVLRHGRLLVDRNPTRRFRFTAAVPALREDVLAMRRPIEAHLARRMAAESSRG